MGHSSLFWYGYALLVLSADALTGNRSSFLPCY